MSIANEETDPQNLVLEIHVAQHLQVDAIANKDNKKAYFQYQDAKASHIPSWEGKMQQKEHACIENIPLASPLHLESTTALWEPQSWLES